MKSMYKFAKDFLLQKLCSRNICTMYIQSYTYVLVHPMVNSNGQLVHYFTVLYYFEMQMPRSFYWIWIISAFTYFVYIRFESAKRILDMYESETKGERKSFLVTKICFSAHIFTLIYVYKHVKSKKGNIVGWNK